MSKADSYRKRAEALAKAIKKRAGLECPPMLKKQKALMAMADNEDWLDGKPSPQGHARELKTAELPLDTGGQRRARTAVFQFRVEFA